MDSAPRAVSLIVGTPRVGKTEVPWPGPSPAWSVAHRTRAVLAGAGSPTCGPRAVTKYRELCPVLGYEAVIALRPDCPGGGRNSRAQPAMARIKFGARPSPQSIPLSFLVSESKVSLPRQGTMADRRAQCILRAKALGG